MTAAERILDEADKYGFQVPYDGTSEFYDRSAVKAYIAGAKSERNKVLDEAIILIGEGYLPAHTTTISKVIEKLNSLKL